MVETLSNILSISFRFLHEKKLESKEAKNFAASNIMLNITSLFTNIIQELKKNITGLDQTKFDIELIKKDLVIKLEIIMKSILDDLANSYPQAPITESTPRMKSIIN